MKFFSIYLCLNYFPCFYISANLLDLVSQGEFFTQWTLFTCVNWTEPWLKSAHLDQAICSTELKKDCVKCSLWLNTECCLTFVGFHSQWITKSSYPPSGDKADFFFMSVRQAMELRFTNFFFNPSGMTVWTFSVSDVSEREGENKKEFFSSWSLMGGLGISKFWSSQPQFRIPFSHFWFCGCSKWLI